MLARAILGVSLAYVKANQLTDDEDFGLGASGDDYDIDRDYDEIEEASGDFQPIKNQVLDNQNLKSIGLGEPKNILDAVEDDLAAAGQEPKLFLALTLGVACLCCLTLLILLGCHRFKKKDEGSYAVYQQGKKNIA
ncbi:unnamed protein product [Oikopleura dioica]|uniref:Syndecan/Neurexin domain-containing protein n=1 Tax=Oikopleura dioica TaxID=34765 RepID=E4XDH8_OIKDI|nr:unnamed protein product [Oikopleura dioica]CBY37637.1 unnamed protein product [Oikopleura dioica]